MSPQDYLNLCIGTIVLIFVIGIGSNVYEAKRAERRQLERITDKETALALRLNAVMSLSACYTAGGEYITAGSIVQHRESKRVGGVIALCGFNTSPKGGGEMVAVRFLPVISREGPYTMPDVEILHVGYLKRVDSVQSVNDPDKLSLGVQHDQP